MKSKFFLTVNKRGSVRATQSRVSLKADEIAISCTLTLPDALFARPQLNAVLVVPENAARPQEINVETTDNIEQAIASVTGLDVRLTVQSAEEL